MATTDSERSPWFEEIAGLLSSYKRDMDDASAVIKSWTDAPGTNRQEYRDALHLQTVSQGRDFQLGAGLLGLNSNLEKDLMTTSADLDRRNTLDLATAQHGFNREVIGDMSEANLREIRETGAQDRAKTAMTEAGSTRRTEIATQGSVDVAKEGTKQADVTARYGYEGQVGAAREGTRQAEISARANLSGEQLRQRGETQRAGMGYQSAERQIRLTGDEGRQSGAMNIIGQVGGRFTDKAGNSYDFGRGTIGETGEQSRQTIRTQADEERRSLAFDRSNAVRTALSNSRRA
jgi:hypothetical protein